MEGPSFVFGPWHAPAVQFPIVCSVLAAFACWAGLTYGLDWLAKTAGVLWILTFLTALVSLLTGHLFAHRLGRYTPWLVLPPSSTGPLHFHAILAMIGLGFSLLSLPGAVGLVEGRPIHILSQFFYGIAMAVFFAWGAHEGGEMTFKMEMVPLNAPRNHKAPGLHRKPRLRTERAGGKA
ncbi:MAG TPA: hypothetical protein VMV05_06715 [bacterium]|nr:hypothetical protein [bacterium]